MKSTNLLKNTQPLQSWDSLVYNDFIAKTIANALVEEAHAHDSIIHDVKGPLLDLDPDEGYLLSLKKIVKVMDQNGRTYKITIEEDEEFA